MDRKLCGTISRPVEAGRRIALPSRHTSRLSGEPGGRVTELVIVPPKQFIYNDNPEFPYLEIWVEDDYLESIDEFFRAHGGFDTINIDHIAWHDEMHGSMEYTKVDDKNRIVLTSGQCNYAKIESRVDIKGARNHLQLWNPEILAKARAKSSADHNTAGMYRRNSDKAGTDSASGPQGSAADQDI